MRSDARPREIRQGGLGAPCLFFTAGQASDAKGFEKLNQGGIKRTGRGRSKQRPRYFVGDKAYDSQNLRRILRRQGTTPVIPKRRKQER